MTNNTTVSDLRRQIDELESKRLILQSERDDLAYQAMVERLPAAVKRAADIGNELAKLTHAEALATAAYKTALRLEAEAKAAEATKQKRADLAEAEAMLPEVAQIATQIDAAMKTLQAATVAFQDKWAKLKRLSGAGPTVVATKVHIERALRTGLRGLPGLSIDLVSPTQRCSASSLNAGWSTQVRNVAAKVEPTKAEAPKQKKTNKTAIEAAI
jgi:hypothetical protein